MAQITLEYTAPSGLQSAANIAAKLGAIPLSQYGDLDMLGMVKISDSVAAGSGEATRTVVLETTDFGDELWADATALAYATKEYYTQVLATKLPGRVAAAEPVVS